MLALFEGYPAWVAATFTVLGALSVAYVAAEFGARLVRAAVLASVGRFGTELSPGVVSAPARLVRATLFLVVGIVLIPPALELAGVPVVAGPGVASLSAWFYQSGLRIVIIVVMAGVVVHAAGLGVRRFEHEVGKALGDAVLSHAERLKRAQTLGRLVLNVVRTLVFGAATLMVLRELNVDVLPILTGASVVGLAVGFGAQTLVKDVISGFFLLLENQVRVGDVAQINGVGGAVEAITLRTIVLRDVAGTVHVFPNGSIATLANLTKDYSFAVLDLGVSYKENVDRVAAVLREIGDELARDAAFASDVLEPMEIFGIEAFGPSEIVVKLRMKTRPSRQWNVGRELRRRIKIRFDAEGIEIPVPPRSAIFEMTEAPAREQPITPSDTASAGRAEPKP